MSARELLNTILCNHVDMGRHVGVRSALNFVGALAAVAAMLAPPICSAADTHPACEHFYRVLSRLPHTELQINYSSVSATPEYHRLDDCAVTFRTDDSLMIEGAEGLPSFRAEEGPNLFVAGWREDLIYAANGSGTGSYAIRKDTALCIIRWDQTSWIDDSGLIIRSHLVNLTAHCRNPGRPQH